jgi:hypothetical protein
MPKTVHIVYIGHCGTITSGIDSKFEGFLGHQGGHSQQPGLRELTARNEAQVEICQYVAAQSWSKTLNKRL